MKPTLVGDQLKIDAWKFINCQIKAEKLKRKTFRSIDDIYWLQSPGDVHIHNLIKLCKLLDMRYCREDWDGNEVCNSNWDIVYFIYKGYKFFELVTKNEGE